MQLERSLLYRADYLWQRSEETLLTIRYYWWCVQCATFVVLPMCYRADGVRGMVWAYSPAYYYEESHGWHALRWEFENPVSAERLILDLREERAERERHMWLTSFDRKATRGYDYGQHFVTPLLDRAPAPWDGMVPMVKAVHEAPEWLRLQAGDTDLFYMPGYGPAEAEPSALERLRPQSGSLTVNATQLMREGQ